VLKGISYKQGLIPAMLVDTATKNQEWSQNSEKPKTSKIDIESKVDVKVGVNATESDTNDGEKVESQSKLDRNDRLEKVKSVIEKKVREREAFSSNYNLLLTIKCRFSFTLSFSSYFAFYCC
jgi:hypothetical protein